MLVKLALKATHLHTGLFYLFYKRIGKLYKHQRLHDAKKYVTCSKSPMTPSLWHESEFSVQYTVSIIFLRIRKL